VRSSPPEATSGGRRGGGTDENGWGPTGTVPSVAVFVTRFLFLVVGLLIATRRPGNAIAWILLAIGAVWGLDSALGNYSAYAVGEHAHPAELARVAVGVANIQWVPAIGLMAIFLLLLFPDGRLPSVRWRRVAWLSAVTITLEAVITLVTPGRIDAGEGSMVTNPFGLSAVATPLDLAQIVVIPLLLVSIVASAASLVVRYRSSRGVERQQLKWLAAAAAAVAGFYALVLAVSIPVEDAHGHVPEWTRLLEAAALLSFGLIPLSIGFAVFRYRLYDIDLIIRRTLIYSALVTLIVGIYLAAVTVLSAALQEISGQSGALAVTVSTLLVIVVFRPLQRRIQRAVDRRFCYAGLVAFKNLAENHEHGRHQRALEANARRMDAQREFG